MSESNISSFEEWCNRPPAEVPLNVLLWQLGDMVPKPPRAITYEHGVTILDFVQDKLCPVIWGEQPPASVLGELTRLREDNAKLKAQVDKQGRTIAFFACTIKSGEGWSQHCEEAMNSLIEEPPQ